MLKIRGALGKYHKLVFEVRYDQGFVYLDRCGAIANRIMRMDPAWVIRGENVNPQGAPLVHAVTGTQLNFNVYKYDFGVDQPIGGEDALKDDDITAFISNVGAVAPIIHEELSLRTFRRKGFRIWYIFPFDSERDANTWIRGLPAVTVSPSLATSLQGELESQSYVFVVATKDRKMRISITPVERLETLDLGTDTLRVLPRTLSQGQRDAIPKQLRAKRRLLANPESAVMIDVDAFVEDPIEIDAEAFIGDSLKLIEHDLPAALAAATKK